jgi:hypothetical protein
MKTARPNCRVCDRPAAKGYFFCTIKHAAEYAEDLVRGNEDHWCPKCGEWSHRDVEDEAGNTLLICGHVATEIREGMGHEEAKARYRAALAVAEQRTRLYRDKPREGGGGYMQGRGAS